MACSCGVQIGNQCMFAITRWWATASSSASTLACRSKASCRLVLLTATFLSFLAMTGLTRCSLVLAFFPAAGGDSPQVKGVSEKGGSSDEPEARQGAATGPIAVEGFTCSGRCVRVLSSQNRSCCSSSVKYWPNNSKSYQTFVRQASSRRALR